MENNTWVCSYCGSEEVLIKNTQSSSYDMNTEEIVDFVNESIYWCDTCNEETKLLKYFEWTEKIAEETIGNKEEYHKILDGSRM